MKRLVLLLLGLFLLLPACGATEPEPTTREVTKAPGSGESGKAHWRTLDLSDPANAEAKAWLIEQYTPYEEKKEVRMGTNKLMLVHDYLKEQIEMIDADNKRTVLLKRMEDGLSGIFPAFAEAIDERYFVFLWRSWIGEWESKLDAGCGIYDTKRLREIPVEFPPVEPDSIHGMYAGVSFAGVSDGALYFQDTIGEDRGGQMHLYAVALDNLDTAQTLRPGENLLEGIPEADLGEDKCWFQQLSPDARYFVVFETGRYYGSGEGAALRIFDLQAKSFVCRVPIDERIGLSLIAFRDERTIYWYDANWSDDNVSPRYAIEITLP